MNSAATFSPAPILQLLASPRAATVFIGAAAWTLGTGWIGAMARFARVHPTPSEESAVFGAALAAATLLSVPALVGAVAGEAVQELFRRPVTARLPGMRVRAARAAWLLGATACVLVAALMAACWSAFELRLVSGDPALAPTPLAILALAVTGFAAGAWLLVRADASWLWVLRFGSYLALSFAAVPLLAAGSTSMPGAIALLAVAALAAHQRFRPGVLPRLATTSVPTLFGDWRRIGEASEYRSLPPPPVDERLPEGPLGRDLSGWRRARRWEQRVLRNGTQSWSGLVGFAALSLGLCAVGPLVSHMLDGDERRAGLVIELARLLMGSAGEGAARGLGTGLTKILGMTMAAQAFIASSPLARGPLRPISRETLGRLAASVTLRVGLAHTAVTLVLGLAVGAALWSASGEPWSGGVPAIAAVAASNLVLFPWFVLVGLGLRRATTAGRGVGIVVALVALGIPAFELAPRGITAMLGSGARTALGTMGAAAAASFAIARWMLRRHYARADLVA